MLTRDISRNARQVGAPGKILECLYSYIFRNYLRLDGPSSHGIPILVTVIFRFKLIIGGTHQGSGSQAGTPQSRWLALLRLGLPPLLCPLPQLQTVFTGLFCSVSIYKTLCLGSVDQCENEKTDTYLSFFLSKMHQSAFLVE